MGYSHKYYVMDGRMDNGLYTNEDQTTNYWNKPLLNAEIQHAIESIHASPHKLVLEFAGAGSLALWWLHSIPGSSHTVLEATDRYTTASLNDLLGSNPRKFVSVDTAIVMARHAYERAVHLNGTKGYKLLLGVACTATIATNYIKHGEHRCVIAVQSGEGIATYDLRMKKGYRDRAGEEMLVSQLLVCGIVHACSLSLPISLNLAPGENLREHNLAFTEPVGRLLTHAVDTVTAYPHGIQIADEPIQGALLSGSFNPLHEGHMRLAEVAEAQLGMPVVFEMPVVNADKGILTPAEIEQRIEQFTHHPVVLTRAPLFSDKASIFPGAVFIIGYDTAVRLLDKHYYQGENGLHVALQTIRDAGCRFLVAGRLLDGEFRMLSHMAIPSDFADMFMPLSEEAFRVDISSTAIRQEEQA